MYVVPLTVVMAQRSLHMTPRSLYSVCVGACMLVNEVKVVVKVGCLHGRLEHCILDRRRSRAETGPLTGRMKSFVFHELQATDK
jgi:hypothetical protein